MIAALCAISACATAPAPAIVGSVDISQQLIEQAVVAMAHGQPAHADELLVTAAREHPDTPAALEVPYWRALLRMDPANPYASASDAVWLLDLYLSAQEPVRHRAEAIALRRVGRALDSLQSLAAIAPVTPEAAGPARRQELEREVARLREALEKSNAELERIRRRLAAPPPS
jgi:hypothetical protein